MDFKQFINESSANQLFNSAVEAFPNTTRRQHVTHTVEIVNQQFTPFQGVRTLLARAQARNEGREYNVIVLFRGVNFNENGPIVIDRDGQETLLEAISAENNDVNVRCSCKDFKFRFADEDREDRSLYGRISQLYDNNHIANPAQLPGCCKHLMRFFEVLRDQGLLVD